MIFVDRIFLYVLCRLLYCCHYYYIQKHPGWCLGGIRVRACSWESFHLLCNSEAGQRFSAVSLEEPHRCLSISSHTFAHELPPLHVFFPLPAQKICHAVCISTPTQPQLSAPCPLHCRRQHPHPSSGFHSGVVPLQTEQSLLPVTSCAASHPPNILMLAYIFCWSIYEVCLTYQN